MKHIREKNKSPGQTWNLTNGDFCYSTEIQDLKWRSVKTILTKILFLKKKKKI